MDIKTQIRVSHIVCFAIGYALACLPQLAAHAYPLSEPERDNRIRRIETMVEQIYSWSGSLYTWSEFEHKGFVDQMAERERKMQRPAERPFKP